MRMLSLRTLALRSLRARPARTLLTTFGVALGVAVILAISISNKSTLEAVTAVFSESSGKAHLVINSSATGNKGFSQDVLPDVQAEAGVAAAIPVMRGQAFLADDVPASGLAISMLGIQGGGVALYGIDPTLDPLAREYKITAGQFLGPDPEAYDIVLVENYATDQEIKLGNDIEIVMPGAAGNSSRLRVIGLMSKEGPGLLNNGAFGVIPLGTAQDIFSRGGDLDQIDIVAQPEAATSSALAKLKAQLQAKLGDRYLVTYPATQGERVASMLTGYQMGLSMFSAIALFVGAFLVYNAFSMTVMERTRETGVLRTLGMTRGQVLRQILSEALLVGLAGSALGLAGGALLARALIRVMEFATATDVREITVPPAGLIMALLVGLGVTLLAATLPAFHASRISPLEALRVRGVAVDGWLVRRGWIAGLAIIVVSFLTLYLSPLPPAIQDRARDMLTMALLFGGVLLVPATVDAWERLIRPVMRGVLGNEGQLGSRNVQRSKTRTTLTVAALMVGVAMIISIRAVTASFGADIRSWIEKYIGGDLYVTSSLRMRTELARRVAEIDGVAAVTPVRYIDVTRIEPEGGTEQIALMALDPASYRAVTSFVFSGDQGDPDRLIDRLAAGDAVFVSSVLAEKYHLAPGDKIRLATRRGQRDFDVAAIVVDFYNQGLVIQANWQDLRRYFGVNDASAFFVKTAAGARAADVRDRVDTLLGRTYHLTVDSNEAIRTRAVSLIGQTTAMFDVLALIAMVVAALGVVNTLTMNVLERTREIGMLRSLGMTRSQVRKMILGEAAMMGVVGGAFGLVFGIFLSRTVLNSMNQMGGFRLAYVMPMQGIIVAVIIAIVFTQVAALWPARRAANTRVIEAIQFE
jgi:putative ABC transport system permease protein